MLQKKNRRENNPNRPQIIDHRHKILITGGSGSEKTNTLFKLKNSKIMMIIILLIKLIAMLRIEMKQNINILLNNMKKLVLNTMKIQRLLLIIQIISRMSPSINSL